MNRADHRIQKANLLQHSVQFMCSLLDVKHSHTYPWNILK